MHCVCVRLHRAGLQARHITDQSKCPHSLVQFDDEFVKANFPQFESAQDMRKNLAATTAMERVRDLDERLSNIVIKVGG